MATPLIILTGSPSKWTFSFMKRLANRLMGKKRGPSTVIESLVRGLRAEKIDFLLDPAPETIINADIAHVVQGADTLTYFLPFRQDGRIKKLIAGPLITVAPEDSNAVMTRPEIDIILQPSMWPKEYWVSKQPQLKEKIHIWPASVFDPGPPDTPYALRLNNPKKTILVYDKMHEEDLTRQITGLLSKKNIEPVIFTYGNFKQEDFFNSLSNAVGMVYLSRSESQGLALQEAWIRDVPTLVIRSTEWVFNSEHWSDPKINAPYLAPEAGAFFKDIAELETLIEKYYGTCPDISFNPRSFCEINFSDAASIEIYRKLVL